MAGDNEILWRDALTLGAGSLKSVDVSAFDPALDYVAIVFDGGQIYAHRYNSASSAAEDSPNVIAPSVGSGRWELQGFHSAPKWTDGVYIGDVSPSLVPYSTWVITKTGYWAFIDTSAQAASPNGSGVLSGVSLTTSVGAFSGVGIAQGIANLGGVSVVTSVSPFTGVGAGGAVAGAGNLTGVSLLASVADMTGVGIAQGIAALTGVAVTTAVGTFTGAGAGAPISVDLYSLANDAQIYSGMQTLWADARNAATGTIASTGDIQIASDESYYYTGYDIYRGYLLFNIPSGTQVTAASLSLTLTGGDTSGNLTYQNNGQIWVYQGTFGNPPTANDFGSFTGSALGSKTGIIYAGGVQALTAIDLTNALTYLSGICSGGGGVAAFCLRDPFDHYNTTPPTSDYSTLVIASGDNATQAYKPKLSITYQ